MVIFCITVLHLVIFRFRHHVITSYSIHYTKLYDAYHLDGDDPEASNWTMEIPIYDNNVPDDHINFAVASNGTLYAAVKTSYNVYNDDLKPQLALLVRRPSGSWEFHGVRNRNNFV